MKYSGTGTISPQWYAMSQFIDTDTPSLSSKIFYLEKNSDDEQETTYTLTTQSCIPTRWLWIFKEFSEKPSAKICLLEKPNVYPILRRKDPETFREILWNIQSINGYFKVITGPNNELWKTSYGITQDWSPSSKKVIKDSESFICLGKGYRQLPSPDGGILIDNPYVKQWMNFHHRIRNETGGTHRPYCKGINCYSTSKDITMEELRIMYMIFEKLGCQLSQFYYA
jgi:hypothetical protein